MNIWTENPNIEIFLLEYKTPPHTKAAKLDYRKCELQALDIQHCNWPSNLPHKNKI